MEAVSALVIGIGLVCWVNFCFSEEYDTANAYVGTVFVLTGSWLLVIELNLLGMQTYGINRLWPAFLVFLGFGFLAMFLLNPRDRGLLIPGFGIVGIGTICFAFTFDTAPKRLSMAFSTFWPLTSLAIIASLFFLFVLGGRTSGTESSSKRAKDEKCDEFWILGVRVDNISMNEVIAKIDKFVQIGTTHQVITANPEFVLNAQRYPDFKELINKADLVTPDGGGFLWARRFTKSLFKEQVTGVDLMWRLSKLASEKGYSIFLLGAAEGVAEMVSRKLRSKYPTLTVAGTYAGSPSLEEEDIIIEKIKMSRPDMLFVAYGSPEQDRWIGRNLAGLGVPVSIGVGGAFDFIAGRSSRAYRLIRFLELEWAYRLYKEPWRWRRMIAVPHFILTIMYLRLASRPIKAITQFIDWLAGKLSIKRQTQGKH